MTRLSAPLLPARLPALPQQSPVPLALNPIPPGALSRHAPAPPGQHLRRGMSDARPGSRLRLPSAAPVHRSYLPCLPCRHRAFDCRRFEQSQQVQHLSEDEVDDRLARLPSELWNRLYG